MRSTAAVLLLAAASMLGAHRRTAFAADVPAARALDPKAGGDKIYEAKSADGLVYWWRGPKRYDPAKGVGLTVILHGSNLSHGWGFWNHDKATFRPDDVVISPDGTTPGAAGTFNFLDQPKDVKRVHALLEEVKKAFKVRGTYLYGHSQGSFFAFLYAGEYPDEVQGFVAHASGIWAGTKLGHDGHHQAIVLMHGTQDPVVPYVQSEGGIKTLMDAGYPTARLYPLEGWNHWPAEHNSTTPHTSQELAWVEGMTTKDPERLEACLDVMADVKDKAEHDWGGLWSLSQHAAEAPFAKDATKARARKAVDVVEALAKKHAQALADVKPGAPADGKPWMAHLPVFLRQFAGVPGCTELAAKWKETLEKHEQKGVAHFDKFFPMRDKKEFAEAFEEGVATIAEGFLWSRAQERFAEGQLGPAVQVSLKTWQKDAKKLKLSKKALKDFAVVELLESAWKKGWDAYAEVCRTAGDT